jgi:hypothetical protein
VTGVTATPKKEVHVTYRSNQAMTYTDIVKLEPRISAIIGSLSPSGEPWAQYVAAKRLLYDLVGYGANVAQLQTEAAYEVVLQAVCDRLRI